MYSKVIAKRLRSQACNKLLARLGYSVTEQKLLAVHLREYLRDKKLSQSQANIIKAYEKVLGRKYKK